MRGFGSKGNTNSPTQDGCMVIYTNEGA
jgi:hypothetical protein